MNYTKVLNNEAFVAGTVASEPQKTHQVEGEKFYEFKVEVTRLSETMDYIPVTVTERFLAANKVEVGSEVKLRGEFRSYNKKDDEKNKLVLYFFAKSIMTEEEILNHGGNNVNYVKLTGFVCKKPIYRQTPFGREICDVIVAVNRLNSKSDYIPCITWGANARSMSNKTEGTKVVIEGRIQSREYKKYDKEGNLHIKTAYEVSCSKLGYLDQERYSEDEIMVS